MQPTTTAVSAWTTVCRRDQLEPLWGEAALVDGRQAAIFLLPDGRVFAVSNLDPATGAAVMSRGIVGSRGDRPTIASPLHKDVFDLETGRCYTKPALRLPTWRVREFDGEIMLRTTPVLVAASHGTSDEQGRAAVAALVDAVQESRPDIRVSGCFIDVQQPDVPTTLGTLHDTDDVHLVPLLLSAGYHVKVDLAEASRDARQEVVVTPALGPDERLTRVLARRLDEAGYQRDDRVVLAVAGSSDADAVQDCHAVGASLAAMLGTPVVVGFISAARPRLPDAVAAARAASPGARVVVATYLLAPGYFAGLARAAGADLTTEPILATGTAPPEELVEIVADLYDAASAR